MARTHTWIDAVPARVFDVLADPQCYDDWVVGAKDIRDADAGFPAPGTRFHHTVGVGPLRRSDHTEVLDSNPPYRLELKAKVRPLGTAIVILLLEPQGRGTRLTLIEDAGDVLTRLFFNPLTHLTVHHRNVESLRRLKALAERAGPAA